MVNWCKSWGDVSLGLQSVVISIFSTAESGLGMAFIIISHLPSSLLDAL